MDNIQVVVDSTVGIDAKLLNRYNNLHIVPLKVNLAGVEYNENQLEVTELLETVEKNNEYPKTSQPAIGEFQALFQELSKTNNKIIVLCLAAGLSGTVQGAKTAANMVANKEIAVIDSTSTAIGLYKLVEFAMNSITQGKSFADIVIELEKRAQKTHTLLTPATLEFLHKGGRIGGAAKVFGTILQIKPVLSLQAGKIILLDKVRTRARSLQRMVQELNNYQNLEYIGVVHVKAEGEAKLLTEQVQKLYPQIPVSCTQAGAVVASHLGAGVIAIIFQEKTK